jgi:hypothetical protein
VKFEVDSCYQCEDICIFVFFVVLTVHCVGSIFSCGETTCDESLCHTEFKSVGILHKSSSVSEILFNLLNYF